MFYFPISNNYFLIKLNKLYNLLSNIPNMNVYLKGNVSTELHYNNNDRIGNDPSLPTLFTIF